MVRSKGIKNKLGVKSPLHASPRVIATLVVASITLFQVNIFYFVFEYERQGFHFYVDCYIHTINHPNYHRNTLTNNHKETSNDGTTQGILIMDGEPVGIYTENTMTARYCYVSPI